MRSLHKNHASEKPNALRDVKFRKNVLRVLVHKCHFGIFCGVI